MAHDVFISYVPKDKVLADAVCARLESRKIRCWIAPRDILPGVNTSRAIMEALRGSRALVLIFTSNTNRDMNVLRELEIAMGNGIPIIPLRTDDVRPTEEIDYYIPPDHWLDAMTPPLEAHMEKLAGTVRAYLALPPVGAPRPFEAKEPPAPPVKSAIHRRWPIAAAVSVALLTIVIAFILLSPPAGTMTINTNAYRFPNNLDPVTDASYDNEAYHIMFNVYETLVTYEGQDMTHPVGRLAEAWNVSRDGLVYTFYLRKGVHFQDNTPFNASCVKYSLDRGVLINSDQYKNSFSRWIAGAQEYANSGGSSTDVQAYLEQDSVHVVNDSCVQIRLAHPYNGFIPALSCISASIVSPTFEQQHGGYHPGDQRTYLIDHVCGTGPYTLFSMIAEPTWEIVLTRNDDYWRGLGKAGKVIITYESSGDDWYDLMKKGEPDILFFNPGYADRVKAIPGYKIMEGNFTFSATYLGFNFAIPPFNDLRVRRAFAESLDYNQLINELYNGYGKENNGVIPEGMAGYNASMPKRNYDPAHAKRLLEEAGFSKSRPITINIFYYSDTRKAFYRELIKTVEGYDLGITFNVQSVDNDQYLRLLDTGLVPLPICGWLADYPYPDTFVQPLLCPDGFYASRIHYNNSEIDRLYQQAIVESDPDKAQRLWDQINLISNEDCPYAYLYQQFQFEVINERLKGYVYNPLHGWCPYYYDIYK